LSLLQPSYDVVHYSLNPADEELEVQVKFADAVALEVLMR
jgi:hypothetical protein